MFILSFSPGGGTYGRSPWLVRHALLALLASLAFWPGLEPPNARAEDIHTDSRTPFLHNIPLHDAQGRLISPPAVVSEDGKPQEPRANPVFSGANVRQMPRLRHHQRRLALQRRLGHLSRRGRPGAGEPWILTDPATHTQIPLFPIGDGQAPFKPRESGHMSDFEFVTNFARHFPQRGGPGEPGKIKVHRSPDGFRMPLSLARWRSIA